MAAEVSMNKDTLESIEWVLSVILSACSCVGMWLIGVFLGNLLFDEVTSEAMAVLLVVSAFFTWLINEIKMEIRYQRLVQMAEETHDN
jgi:uncharacterized membrane protein YfcA